MISGVFLKEPVTFLRDPVARIFVLTKVYFNKILSLTIICISIDIAQADVLFRRCSELLPSKTKNN
jgi:hypothetical protein